MSERLDYWARRKAAVAAEVEAEAKAVESQTLAEEQAVLEEKSDAEILEELGLPDPETLCEGDDFSGFMAKAVPDRIRRRALRFLWRSNPVLANVDGLIDYGEDFTDSAMVVENLQTAYQVGKGMLAHIEKMVEAEAAQDPEEPVLEEEAVEPEPDLPAEEPVLAFVEPEQAPLDAEDEIRSPAPRRMTFTYEADSA